MKQGMFELVVFILITLIIELALVDVFLVQQSAMALFMLIFVTAFMMIPTWIVIIKFTIKECRRNKEDC